MQRVLVGFLFHAGFFRGVLLGSMGSGPGLCSSTLERIGLPAGPFPGDRSFFNAIAGIFHQWVGASNRIIRSAHDVEAHGKEAY